MNWRFLISSVVVITVVVVISIIVLTYFGTISFDASIVLSSALGLVPNVLTAIGYFLKPKVALEIKNVEFVKSSHAVDGYQVKALVTNNGKKICLDLDATFQIKDAQGKLPSLLYVSIDKTDGDESVSRREAPMEDVGYAWIDEKERITLGVWKELRGKDTVGLLFPYASWHIGSISVDRVSSSSQECLLRLGTNLEYYVTIEIKGEDSEKNTIPKSKSAKIKPPS